jgi:ubiquitin C-terminal hydrolase
MLTSNDRINFDEELGKDVRTDPFIYLVSEVGRLGLLAAMLTVWFIQVKNVVSTINQLYSKLQMF